MVRFHREHAAALFLTSCLGKYVGSRPVKLSKSDWKERSVVHKKAARFQQQQEKQGK